MQITDRRQFEVRCENVAGRTPGRLAASWSLYGEAPVGRTLLHAVAGPSLLQAPALGVLELLDAPGEGESAAEALHVELGVDLGAPLAEADFEDDRSWV